MKLPITIDLCPHFRDIVFLVYIAYLLVLFPPYICTIYKLLRMLLAEVSKISEDVIHRNVRVAANSILNRKTILNT